MKIHNASTTKTTRSVAFTVAELRRKLGVPDGAVLQVAVPNDCGRGDDVYGLDENYMVSFTEESTFSKDGGEQEIVDPEANAESSK